MKKTGIALCSILISLAVVGQDITGPWYGALKVQGMQLRIVFNIMKTAEGFSSTMDSPDQGVKAIPVTTTVFDGAKLTLTIAGASIEYTGMLKDNNITGIFKQGGQQFMMDLSRQKMEATKRPQEPVKPYPYYTEEVVFKNDKAGISLAGTLTLPAKDNIYPVVILITGSGPQNRDEELLGHKPFLVIADYLTRNGIAVLRYDDRGVARSTGNFSAATSADFATDAEAAIAYVQTRKEINPHKIGLMGHSEGGMIAPMVASANPVVNFIVLLAGPGLPGNKLLLLQQQAIAKRSGMAEDKIAQSQKINAAVFNQAVRSANTEKLKDSITAYLTQVLSDTANAWLQNGTSKDVFIKTTVNQVASPWMQYFLKYDPAPALEKVQCPVLAVNGEKDVQVLPKENLAAISKALQKGGNKNVTTKEFPGLNHLFQECTTGLPGEYAVIEQTFSPMALHEITLWIQNQVK